MQLALPAIFLSDESAILHPNYAWKTITFTFPPSSGIKKKAICRLWLDDSADNSHLTPVKNTQIYLLRIWKRRWVFERCLQDIMFFFQRTLSIYITKNWNQAISVKMTWGKFALAFPVLQDRKLCVCVCMCGGKLRMLRKLQMKVDDILNGFVIKRATVKSNGLLLNSASLGWIQFHA